MGPTCDSPAGGMRQSASKSRLHGIQESAVRVGYMGMGVLISTDSQDEVPHGCTLSQLPICAAVLHL